jgi:hypothetical protein
MTEQTTTLPVEPPPAEPAAPKVRRTLGLPVVAAIGVAALLIGGLAGGIIGYAVHSDGPDFNGRPGQMFQQGGPGNGQMPQPPNGQMPGQSQQQDDSGSES